MKNLLISILLLFPFSSAADEPKALKEAYLCKCYSHNEDYPIGAAPAFLFIEFFSTWWEKDYRPASSEDYRVYNQNLLNQACQTKFRSADYGNLEECVPM